MNIYILSIFLCSGLIASVVNGVDICSTGEKFWCSSLQNAKLCSAVQHCKSTVWLNELPPNDSSEVCLFCESVVNDVLQYIKLNETEKKISDFMSTVCQLIPDRKASQECQQVIKEYLPIIIDLIKNNANPKIVCGLLQLCKEVKEMKVIQTPGPECDDCIKFVGDIKVKLFGEDQKKKVIHELEKYICSNLLIGQKECTDIVERLVPKVLDDLSQKFVPENICHAFCKNGGVVGGGSGADDDVDGEAVLMQKIIVMFVNLQSSASSDECHICKQIMDDLQHLLQDKSTQKLMNDVIKKYFCSFLGSYSRECEIIVDDYSHNFYEFLVNELDSSTRCHMFGFCNATNTNTLRFQPHHYYVGQQDQQQLQHTQQHNSDNNNKNDVGNPTCEICKYIVDEIKKFIGDNATEAKIIDALDKICYQLPKSYEKRCEEFVDKYGKQLVDLLLSGISSNDVCESINLCLQQQHGVTGASPYPENGKCEVCEIALQYMVSLLDQNATVIQIESLLNKICHLLPQSMQTQCSDMVDEFGGLIIHYLATSLQPHEICKVLNLCNSGTTTKLYYKCIAGPSYWCASKQNAKICQAEDHCVKYVWNVKVGSD